MDVEFTLILTMNRVHGPFVSSARNRSIIPKSSILSLTVRLNAILHSGQKVTGSGSPQS